VTADLNAPAADLRADLHAALSAFFSDRSQIDALLMDTVVQLSQEVETLTARLDALQAGLLAAASPMPASPVAAGPIPAGPIAASPVPVSPVAAPVDLADVVPPAPRRTPPAARPDQPATWEHLSQLGDEEWLETLLASVDGEHPHGVLPGFSSAEDQASYIGYSGKAALTDGYRFYLHMRESMQAYGPLLGADTRILDFGVGWGRHARMWLRDVPGDNLTLADPSGRAVRTCEEIGMPGTKVQLPNLPPGDLPEAHFDLAYAYSVFSHLSPRSHTAWAEEWARVIKPGGLAIITTEGRWFLDYVRMLHDDPAQRVSIWHERIATGFGDDFDAIRAAYDRGEFIFADTSPDAWAGLYGDSLVPESWIRETWGAHFDLLDWVADSSRFDQAVAVLRRR